MSSNREETEIYHFPFLIFHLSSESLHKFSFRKRTCPPRAWDTSVLSKRMFQVSVRLESGLVSLARGTQVSFLNGARSVVAVVVVVAGDDN